MLNFDLCLYKKDPKVLILLKCCHKKKVKKSKLVVIMGSI